MVNIQVLLPDSLKTPMGGMGEQAKNVIDNFSKNYYFDIVGSSKGESHKDENYTYKPVINLPLPLASPDPLAYNLLRQTEYIRESINLDSDPDLIHAFDWSSFYAGVHASHHYNCPLVVTVQLSVEKMMDSIGAEKHPSQQKLLRMNSAMEMMGLMRSDHIIQVSESYAENFPPIFNNKTSIVGNGVDLEEYSDYSKVDLPGGSEKKLVYIGRFAYMKNIQSLIQADIPENTDLIFIGGNRGGNDELLNAVSERDKKDDQVHYIGPKYGQEKIDILCSADGMIVPSKHEPFGIVALEALASKSVLISSFEGGMGDFLDEDFALNCGTDIEGIECAIRQFSEMDDSEKKSRTEKGYNEAKKHSWDNIASQVESVYSSLV